MNLSIFPTDVLTEIFNYLKLRDLIPLEQICIGFKKLIRETKWPHLVKLYSINFIDHVISNYYFTTYDFSFSDIKDHHLEQLRCHSIKLIFCNNITNVGIKYLSNCGTLYIGKYHTFTCDTLNELRKTVNIILI
jgi:hypothetical protein